MSGVFSNLDALNEQPVNRDLLGYSEEINRVEGRVKNTVESGRSTIIAYLGGFGVGKSTVLREVKGRLGSYDWVEFETWRYSNRNELWDAFVISTTSTLTKNKDEWDIADEVDGGALNKKESFLLLIWLLAIWTILTGASILLWRVYSQEGQFGEAYLKYAVPVIFPLLLLIGLGRFFQLNHLTDKKPLKRVFQLENLLHGHLKKMKRPLVIVIEDVDRSGESGAVFMETLHEFLDKRKGNKPLVIIAPQTNDTFDALSKDARKKIDHSLKVYDEKMYFNSKILHGSVDSFYKDLEFKKKYQKYKPAMIEITKELVYYYQSTQLTIRTLKHALREVNWFIESYPDHSPAVALVFAIARMVGGRNLDDLAVRQLSGTFSPARSINFGTGPDKYVIDRENVFGICLAIAAGSDGSAKKAHLVDQAGKFNQESPIRFIDIELNGDKDVVESLNGGARVKAVLRKEYYEQLTI